MWARVLGGDIRAKVAGADPVGHWGPWSGFKQRSNITYLHFSRIVLAAVLRIDSKGTRKGRASPSKDSKDSKDGGWDKGDRTGDGEKG